jgi:hypothetical protein
MEASLGLHWDLSGTRQTPEPQPRAGRSIGGWVRAWRPEHWDQQAEHLVLCLQADWVSTRCAVVQELGPALGARARSSTGEELGPALGPRTGEAQVRT